VCQVALDSWPIAFGKEHSKATTANVFMLPMSKKWQKGFE
jgi:hypothetical protein